MLNKLKNIKLTKGEDGFTLIELIVVIVIIGILAAIAVPLYLEQQKVAIAATVQSDARNTVEELQTALTRYPNAQGFVVYGAGDTPVYSFISPVLGNNVAAVPTENVPIPPGYVGVFGVTSADNEVVVVDPADGGDNALSATSDGAWNGYIVHAESPKTGYWYEFNSLTGEFYDGQGDPSDPDAGECDPGNEPPLENTFINSPLLPSISDLRAADCDGNGIDDDEENNGGGYNFSDNQDESYTMSGNDLAINGLSIYDYPGYGEPYMESLSQWAFQLNSPAFNASQGFGSGGRDFRASDFNGPLLTDLLANNVYDAEVSSMVLHTDTGESYDMCSSPVNGQACWVGFNGSDDADLDASRFYVAGYIPLADLEYNRDNCGFGYQSVMIYDGGVSGGHITITYEGHTTTFPITTDASWLYYANTGCD